jgi:hypothetical protein
MKKRVLRRVIRLGRHHELRVYTIVMEVREVSLRSVLFNWELSYFGSEGRELEIGVQMKEQEIENLYNALSELSFP